MVNNAEGMEPTFVGTTIVATNYISMALVLANSFLRHHSTSEFVIILTDGDTLPSFITDVDPRIRFIGERKLSAFVPDIYDMVTIYDVTEFATAIKPFVLAHLLHEVDCVLYLDPDIFVYSNLQSLVEKTVAHGISLTPHCLREIQRDFQSPTENDILQAGVYNLGFIGVAKGAEPFLDWWGARLQRDAISDPDNHLFTDQRWVDLAVPIFSPYVEKRPTFNVAYWNIDQRSLEVVGDTFFAEGQPLHFFHFSGFDPTKPWWLSKYHQATPRNLVSSNRALTLLCLNYAQELLASQHEQSMKIPYKWSEPLPGLPLSLSLRRYFRRELIRAEQRNTPKPPNPFQCEAINFLHWLNEYPENSAIPRYLNLIMESRIDLQAAFGDALQRGDTRGIMVWAEKQCVKEHPWINLLPAQTKESPQRPPQRCSHLAKEDGLNVDVVGYFRTESGVGEAARLLVSALESVEISVSTLCSSRTFSRQEISFKTNEAFHSAVQIFAVNADQLSIVFADLQRSLPSDSYKIGQWFWELEQFPENLNGAFQFVDEVWTATQFMTETVKRHAPPGFPVHLMPLPLVAPRIASDFHRQDLDLDTRFMFLNIFDFLSVVHRKNPKGLLQAYMSEFEENEGAQLVLKCINGEKNLQDLEELRWISRHRSDIRIMNEYLKKDVLSALTASADCYISLHRSEGLGLTIAEAMSLGVPAIATGYSGNMDFMDKHTSIIVPWDLVPVGDRSEPYSATATWAEPDLPSAQEAMRRLFDDHEERKRLGKAGREHLINHFSQESCGRRMFDRLMDIQRSKLHV